MDNIYLGVPILRYKNKMPPLSMKLCFPYTYGTLTTVGR